jgi:hypothetical protein
MKPEFFIQNRARKFPQGFGVRQSSGAFHYRLKAAEGWRSPRRYRDRVG